MDRRRSRPLAVLQALLRSFATSRWCASISTPCRDSAPWGVGGGGGGEKEIHGAFLSLNQDCQEHKRCSACDDLRGITRDQRCSVSRRGRAPF